MHLANVFLLFVTQSSRSWDCLGAVLDWQRFSTMAPGAASAITTWVKTQLRWYAVRSTVERVLKYQGHVQHLALRASGLIMLNAEGMTLHCGSVHLHPGVETTAGMMRWLRLTAKVKISLCFSSAGDLMAQQLNSHPKDHSFKSCSSDNRNMPPRTPAIQREVVLLEALLFLRGV